MKKLFILFAITIMALNVNAQWFIGGKLGLNVKDTKTDTDNGKIADYTTIGFSIAPKGGYYFNEKLALGLSVSVGVNLKKDYNEINSSSDFILEAHALTLPWRINPFVRYSVFTYKRFSLILEGRVGIGGEQYQEEYTYPNSYLKYHEDRQATIGIGVLNITPILGFKLSDHFQLEAGLNFLNLGYNIDIINRTLKTTDIHEIENINKTKTINHDFNIGFNSSSILVVSQLTIGVIYKF